MATDDLMTDPVRTGVQWYKHPHRGPLSITNAAAQLYNQGPQFQGFGDVSQQAQQDMLGLAGQGNPFLAGANQAVSGVMNTQNPFLQGFQGFQNQQNQHLDGMFNQAASQIQDRLNSQFGGGGRSMSGQHAGVMGRELGNFGTNFYGNAFDNMQNRNLQALQGGSSAWTNQNNDMMQAAGMIPGLNDAKYDDARVAMGIGGMQDQMAQAEMDQDWSHLQKFSDIVAQLQGWQGLPDSPSDFEKVANAAVQVGSGFAQGLAG